MTKDELVKKLAERIARMEGFFAAKPNPSQRNNNPGNLRAWGKLPVVDGFVKFPRVQEGWKALEAQVRKNVFTRKLTFEEFFCGGRGYGGYAPSADNNDCKAYALFVAKAFREPITTKIHTLATTDVNNPPAA